MHITKEVAKVATPVAAKEDIATSHLLTCLPAGRFVDLMIC
jgi:hypothetical protein